MYEHVLRMFSWTKNVLRYIHLICKYVLSCTGKVYLLIGNFEKWLGNHIHIASILLCCISILWNFILNPYSYSSLLGME